MEIKKLEKYLIKKEKTDMLFYSNVFSKTCK